MFIDPNKMTERKAMLIVFIINLTLLLSLLFHFHRLTVIWEMEKSGEPQEYLVTNKECNASSSSSYMDITQPGGEVRISIPSWYCKKIEVGSRVGLYYSEQYNFFNVPGLEKQERWVGMLAVAFFGSLFLWRSVRYNR